MILKIIEETKILFSIQKIEVYEKSKFFNMKFSTFKEKLPKAEDIEKYLDSFPKRDLVKISLNFYDEDVLMISIDNFNTSKYWEFINNFDDEDPCNISIEVTKKVENGVFSVYSFDNFANEILNDNTVNILQMFSVLLKEQKNLLIECFDKEYFLWGTKSIAFVGVESGSEYKLINRLEIINNIRSNANCTTLEKYQLVPEDFKIEVNNSSNILTNVFDKLATLLSLLYISSFSTIDNESFMCEICGYSNVAFSSNLDSIVCNEEIYKIYNWAFVDGNVVDKLLIARNAISLHCKYVKIIDIDERTFESIKSNHQLYLKSNATKYLEAKEQVSKFIVDISSQINDNISKLTGEFKNNFIAIIGFFLTVYLVNLASEQPFNNIFTRDITKIFEILMIASVAYAVISIFYSNSKRDKQIKTYDSIKEKYTSVLSEIEITELFDDNAQFEYVKNDYKKQLTLFSVIWIISIVLMLIIVEFVGIQSIAKVIVGFVLKVIK